MDRVRVVYRPTGGVNFDREEITLEENQAADLVNMLVSNQVLRSRPLASDTTFGNSIPAGEKVDYARTFQVTDTGFQVVAQAITNQGKIIDFIPNGAEITGAGTTFGSRELHNSAVVNGVMLYGNNTGGLIRHDFAAAAATYTVISGAKYRYVTGAISRAVGAYDITSGSNDPRKVGWSVGGDETDWTSAGSGSSILAETPDYITGLENIRNIVVVLRARGITLGYPTNVGTSAFRWENHTRFGTGCPHPSTVASYDNELFFVGNDDVYRFDLDRPSPIGGPIRRPLFAALRANAKYRGFITTSDFGAAGGSPRRRYHLVPFIPATLALAVRVSALRHYCFDFESGTWSTHTYSETIRAAMSYGVVLGSVPQDGVVLFRDSPAASGAAKIFIWTTDQYRNPQGSNIDPPGRLTGRRFLVNDDPANDYTLDDALVVWSKVEDFDGGEGAVTPSAPQGGPPFTFALHAIQKYEHVGAEQQIPATDLTDDQADWFRTWVNLRVTGQFFQPVITVGPEMKIKIERIEMFFTSAGKSKSGLTN